MAPDALISVLPDHNGIATSLRRGKHLTQFEYVSVLLAIVISIAIAHILSGIARMIWDGISNFSFPLVHWIIFTLFLCVDYWFYLWSLHEQDRWSFLYVCFLLWQASLIYLASHLIVPTAETESPVDMKKFFADKHKGYMVVCIITAASNEALNLTLPGFGSLHIGLLVACWITIFAIGYRARSEKIQNLLVVANILVTANYAVTYVSALK